MSYIQLFTMYFSYKMSLFWNFHYLIDVTYRLREKEKNVLTVWFNLPG